MTPQERQLMAELFDRLATLENAPRDPDAEAMIREGFRRAPNAAYALVQTVLVQDEALKAANAHIQEYEQQHGGAAAGAAARLSRFDARQPCSAATSRAARCRACRKAVRRRAPPRRQAPRWAPPGYGGDPWGRRAGYQQGYQQGAPMQARLSRRNRVAAAVRSSAPRRRRRPA